MRNLFNKSLCIVVAALTISCAGDLTDQPSDEQVNPLTSEATEPEFNVAAHHAEMLQNRLDLTDEQRQSVEAVFAEHNRDEYPARLQEILTVEQYEGFEEIRANAHQHHGRPNATEHAARLQEHLGLSDEQTAQIATVFESTARAERHDQLEAILTTEQFTQFEELRARHHGQRSGAAHEGAPAHAQRLQNRLSLSDEQTAQIETVFEEGQTRAERIEGLNAILTPEQRTEFEQLHASGGACGHVDGETGCCGGAHAEGCDHADGEASSCAGDCGHGASETCGHHDSSD